MPTPIVLYIEGVISAGKSTIIPKLKKSLEDFGCNVVVVNEPVDGWSDILPLFYSDTKKYAYHFQTRAFCTRVLAYDSIMENKDVANVDVFICERSMYSDRIFVETLKKQGNFTDLEYKDYMQLWTIWQRLVPPIFRIPTLVVYMDTNIDEAMKRIKERDRDGESGVTGEYQTMLKDSHEEFFKDNQVTLNGTTIPVLRIDSTVNFRDNDDAFKKIFDSVSRALGML